MVSTDRAPPCNYMYLGMVKRYSVPIKVATTEMFASEELTSPSKLVISCTFANRPGNFRASVVTCQRLFVGEHSDRLGTVKKTEPKLLLKHSGGGSDSGQVGTPACAQS